MIDVAFGFINLAIMPLWFGLIVMPRKKWVYVAIDVFVFVAAVIFMINLIPGLSQALPVILQPTLESVGALLATPNGTLGSWTHFVIGDLWIGRWIAQDAHAQGLSQLWIVPILILTLLFGPLGIFFYFVYKGLARKRFGTA